MTDHSLPRTERLRTFGAIRRLFGQGDGGFVYPLRYVCYTEADEAFGAEVLFSVPKNFISGPTSATCCAAGPKRPIGFTKRCCGRASRAWP